MKGLLEGCTATPGLCYFAFCDRYGLLSEGESEGILRVNTPLRSCVLLQGRLDTVGVFAAIGH